ncbi:MAG: EAL domain-containing protein [Anaerolineae bacterium]
MLQFIRRLFFPARPRVRSQLYWVGTFFMLMAVVVGIGIALLIREYESGIWQNVVLLGAGLVVVVVLMMWIAERFAARWIIWPAEQLAAGAIRLQQGEFALRIGTTGRNEIGQAGQALDGLAEQLQARERKAQEQVRALNQSDARYHALVQDKTEFIARCQPDGTLSFVNGAYARALNQPEGELLGQSLFERMSGDDRQRVLSLWGALTPDGAGVTSEHRLVLANGTARWHQYTARALGEAGRGITEIAIVGRDITERKEVEEALLELNADLEKRVLARTGELRESEERYELAARGSNEGLWDWNLESNRIYYSPRWKAMLGYGEEEIGDTIGEWYHRVHVEDLLSLQADLDAHWRGETSHLENEHRILHADGAYRWVLTRGLAVARPDGQHYRMVGSQTDITRRKEAEQRLIYDALHEPLTALPNRALFMDRLTQAIKQANREPERGAAALVIDLDRFKVVNDSLGHLLGDQLIIIVAQRLESVLRPTDTVARLGGDEFAVLLTPICEIDAAVQVADRIQAIMQTSLHLNGHEVTLSASIGIALVGCSAEGRPPVNPADVLRNADTAMNRAKALGRARAEIFDDSMHAHALAILELEADLRQALERQEFRVYYQPIYSLVQCKPVGAEALIRWQHPERGFILPDQFIAVAEESGLIAPIGEWMFRTACAQAQAWRASCDPTFQVAVNFSALQFQNARLAEWVQGVLLETGLAPAALKIEITETTVMQDLTQSRRILNELDELGVQIAIDDFGNSYSALGQLKRLPVKVLKIDQSFLRDVPHDLNNSALTTAILAMSRGLGLRVIAEGVETPDQLRFLSEHACDEIQGFLLSRALPAEAFMQLLPALSDRIRQFMEGEGVSAQ